MKSEDLETVRMVVHARSGVAVDISKEYAIESRLAPLARRDSFADVGELVQAIRARRDEGLMWSVTEALIQGETCFFRDREPFALFRDDMLPALAARADRPVRVWSAACSTGQEPYSLAMIVDEVAPRFPGLKVELFASDLSERRLEKAQSGLYTQFEVQRGLPIRLLVRHFEKVEEVWRLSQSLRQMVRFRRINLLADLRALGQYDVIFCRNVISSLDPALRGRVLEQMAQALAPGGWLVLGQDERPMGLTEALESISGWDGAFGRNPAFRAAA
ncbi:MAG: protein-glutamate O-methyltransferase CheR [Caulobacteraceae bacterium]|nr:protein-glutamate O-methyltransferase CheR [Caulobacteraceae bacterium]